VPPSGIDGKGVGGDIITTRELLEFVLSVDFQISVGRTRREYFVDRR